jgi:hypothetical protein
MKCSVDLWSLASVALTTIHALASSWESHRANDSSPCRDTLPAVDTTVGYVLLGSSAIPAALGFVLSLEGLKKVKVATETVTEAGKKTNELLVQQTPHLAAIAPGAQATDVANVSKQAIDTAGQLTEAVGGVEASLKALIGVFAPARVFLALSLLLIVASLFPLGVLSVSASSGSATTTTVVSK